jgi:hypothetical protein
VLRQGSVTKHDNHTANRLNVNRVNLDSVTRDPRPLLGLGARRLTLNIEVVRKKLFGDD